MSSHDSVLRTLNEVPTLRNRLEAELPLHFSDSEVFGILLSVEEAVVNGLKHGNQFDPDKSVRVSYTIDDGFTITIEDDGEGFNQEDVPDPLAPENLERASGRGLLLMKCHMTEVEYSPKGNRVYMRKALAEAVDEGGVLAHAG